MAVVRLLDCKQIVIALGGARVSLSLAKILYAYDYGIAIGRQNAIAPAHDGHVCALPLGNLMINVPASLRRMNEIAVS